MRSDPAPFMAKLFLLRCKSKWLLQIKKSNLHEARKFAKIFFFIDDLYAINDNWDVEKKIEEI